MIQALRNSWVPTHDRRVLHPPPRDCFRPVALPEPRRRGAAPLVLMVAAVISGAIGEPGDAIAILVIVLLNAMIGFIQEHRAERAMAALKKLAAATARVLRGGAVSEIPAAALVPGDVVLLDAGGVVPADLRLLEAVGLRIEEAVLTGESTPVEKQVAALVDPELQIGDRRNMAYKGTIATYGRGRGVAVATGMQTEFGKIAALLAVPAARGLSKAGLESQMPRVAELPFDSERKCMTTLHRRDGGVIAFTKGAPERLVEKCVAVLNGAEQVSVQADAILAQAERMAHDGLRVIAFAFRVWPALPAPLRPEQVEVGLVFLGLVGMIDPPRPEAAEAVAVCKAAGVTPVMVTGDHPATAKAIAVRLGIMSEGTKMMTGRDLIRLDRQEFAEQVKDIRVYARVDPAQKIRIVEALQSRGEFVAMTGDGVNDAPAMKRAEIGIAMGRMGTDVAREASHMVLLDDNFATIVSAVREGRMIHDNIRKFIRYVMTGNIGEIVCIFVAPFLGLPLPLLPIQILWVNLVTDGLPGLALAAEREELAIMRRPPRPPAESVFAHGLGRQVVWSGVLVGALSVGAQAWAYNAGSPHWQTVAFTVLTFCQLFMAIGVRSERESTFTIGVASNPPLFGAIALTFALQIAIIYVPPFQTIFKTRPLTAEELAFCIAMPSLLFVAMECEKWMIRRVRLYGD